MKKKKVLNAVLWSPSDERIKSSQMYKFIKIVNEKYNLKFSNFSELHTWSIENKADFWSAVWDFFDVIGSKGIEPYIDPINQMPGSNFFPNVPPGCDFAKSSGLKSFLFINEIASASPQTRVAVALEVGARSRGQASFSTFIN